MKKRKNESHVEHCSVCLVSVAFRKCQHTKIQTHTRTHTHTLPNTHPSLSHSFPLPLFPLITMYTCLPSRDADVPRWLPAAQSSPAPQRGARRCPLLPPVGISQPYCSLCCGHFLIYDCAYYYRPPFSSPRHLLQHARWIKKSGCLIIN